MFRECLHRTYQALIRDRKPRFQRVPRSGRPAATRLGIEVLEDRNLLSTLSLTGGDLIYAPSSGFNNTLTISDNPATHRYTFVDMTELITLGGSFISPSGNHTHTVNFGDGNISSITVNMFNQEFVVNIEQTVANVPLTVNLGNGNDTVNISPVAQNLNNIQGDITVHGGQGVDSLYVVDRSNASGQTFTMAAGFVSRSGAAAITYTALDFLTISAGNGNDTFNVSSTVLNTTLNTGSGYDTVNVNGTGFGGTFGINKDTGGATVNIRATNAPVTLISASPTTVNVGNAGSIQAICGAVTISGSPGSLATVNVDDSNDDSFRSVSLDTVTIGSLSFGSITGLAPAAIQYEYAGTDTATVQTGTGGATVYALATGVPVNLVGHSLNTTVNVGNAGSVQQILGQLTITDPPVGAFVTVNVDDSADTTGRTVSLNTFGGYGRLTGLAPGAILYKYEDTSSVTVRTGVGSLTAVYVLATDVPVSLIGYGSNTVNVGNDGSIQAIHGLLTISGSPGSLATVNVDDSADPTGRTVSLDMAGPVYGRITGLAQAAIQYEYADTSFVTVQTGIGGATVNVLATGVPVNLIGNSFNTTVNVGDAGSVQQILNPLTITNPPSYTTVNVDDSADGSTPTVTLDTVMIGGANFGSITGLAPAAILYKYVDTNNVTINTGPGRATVNALTAVKPLNLIGDPSGPISLFASDGDNTWNIPGQNAGTLSSSLLLGTVTFSGATNLTGGNGTDDFFFADGAGVDGTIDGGGGTNTVDYSAYSSSVLVDLQTGAATGVSGGIANIQNVTGGTGGGAGVYNILVGNGGNVLTGGDGRRNLLIAGAAASTLQGGNEDDILIGGTTAYDTEVGMVSLQAIMDYWSNTADDYATRVANLMSGNGVSLLDATMVTNNGGGNTLMGNNRGAGEMNLFYGMDPTLETTDFNAAIGEQFINC
jgi:hypothetical protein